ncbi:MAG: hypothetical protein UT32_C0006G0023 [Parcubacteria group bacterium GW2011_GWC2_39_14]|nr:MAG: hypothetical protein UT32_C0006G0023 [Parcubacteria group bacterium GW2011_GWC2_39_14]KKR54811.1 MAG: hypothetical protein UT91_C0009G0023 [Parcubacteria group bacterium GW2011_GWA2_40_23]
MRRSTKTILKGTFILVLSILVIVFFIVIVYIYQDLKNVENNVFNLYNQVKTQNVKMDKISLSDEKLVQQSIKFTEATKNWQPYQDNDFGFQLKSPVSWGTVAANFRSVESLDKKATILEGKFSNLLNTDYLDFVVLPYDEALQQVAVNAKFASSDLGAEANKNKLGECQNSLFEILKTYNLGEIRSCQVRENILKQRFVLYRYVKTVDKVITNRLVAIYPENDFFIKVNLPDDVVDEVDYFIQSIIFMK